MSSTRAVLQRAVKRAAALADTVTPRRRGITILIYHHVGAGTGGEVDLPVDVFVAQMRRLAGRVVTLENALASLAGPPPEEPDPVVVTFDDGTADFVDHALPVLAEHGIPATLYLATGFVEEQRPYGNGIPPLTWDGLAEARDSGLVSIGSHTHGHALLDRCDDPESELDRSIALIEDRLGVTPRDFAHPKAVPGTPRAEAAIRARFRSAALAGTRPNRYGDTDPYRLARSPIQRGDGDEFFARKAAGGMGLEDTLRRVVNRVRYRGATS